jgi:hypothetical protein
VCVCVCVCLFACGFRGVSASGAICACIILRENISRQCRTNIVYTVCVCARARVRARCSPYLIEELKVSITQQDGKIQLKKRQNLS